MVGTTAAALRREIRRMADPPAAEFLQRFFKTGRGEYAHGDRFLGIRVPALRRLARACRTLPPSMLRYAIERFPERRRQQYLRGEV